MPITRPLAETIRRRIAQVASDLSGHAADYFLDLIGPVEPVMHGTMDGEGSWRLASYFGTQQDAFTIEHAITIVHREHPLMRAARVAGGQHEAVHHTGKRQPAGR